jgi:hypothetical protein
MRDEKRSWPERLATLFFQSFVISFVRALALSWYIYFALQFFGQHVQGDGYMFWIMFPLSALGLWHLIDVLAKALRLTPREQSQSGDRE